MEKYPSYLNTIDKWNYRIILNPGLLNPGMTVGHFNRLTIEDMYKMPLSSLKPFVHKLIFCGLRQNFRFLKDHHCREFFRKNIINLVSKFDLGLLKKVIVIISMDLIVHVELECLPIMKTNCLFLQNQTKAQCLSYIIEHLSHCSYNKLLYIEHILLLEHWKYISFYKNSYKTKEFAKLIRGKGLIGFDYGSNNIAQGKILRHYQKEARGIIQKFTQERWILYDTLVKLEDNGIIFFY